jgi:hypothetical protein
LENIMSWPCFLIAPTGMACRSLRRYTATDTDRCPVHGTWGHAATFPLEPGPITRDARGFIVGKERPGNDDPRWPTHCEACGYAFRPDDPRVLDIDEIFTAPDDQRYHVRVRRRPLPGAAPAPAGAMWIADWIPKGDAWTGPDGRCLMLRLPDGHDWMIDGPSRSGGKWERTGEPPQITARPSILSPGYHGWLTDGVLSDDLDGRRY